MTPTTTSTAGARGSDKSTRSAAAKTPAGRTSVKTPAAKTTGAKSPAGRTGTAKTAAGKRPVRKAAAATAPATTAGPAAGKPTRSAAETERIRAALAARLAELREEYDAHLTEIAELQRDRLTDTAGDDQADTGSKTFEREQEISLAQSIQTRSAQVERALERLDEGSYGWCERCSSPIPVERLAAFPSATLCVACKQLEERR